MLISFCPPKSPDLVPRSPIRGAMARSCGFEAKSNSPPSSFCRAPIFRSATAVEVARLSVVVTVEPEMEAAGWYGSATDGTCRYGSIWCNSY